MLLAGQAAQACRAEPQVKQLHQLALSLLLRKGNLDHNVSCCLSISLLSIKGMPVCVQQHVDLDVSLVDISHFVSPKLLCYAVTMTSCSALSIYL